MSAETKAISRRLIDEAFNSGNIAVVDEVVDPAFVNHDPATADQEQGIEGAKASIAGYRTAFPDLRITIEGQFAEGDHVVTRWTGRGTQQGELLGLQPTGKQVTVTGITIDRFSGGRIAESWTNWDTLGMLQQLGAVPALATA